MPKTINVMGLPDSIIQDLQKLVTTLQTNLGPAGASQGEASNLPANEWIAQFRAWAESHPRREVVIDDCRDSIYDGRGE